MTKPFITLVLAFLLAACGGGVAATTTTELTTTTTASTTTTTLPEAVLYEVLCWPIISVATLNTCEGDDTYVSVALRTDDFIDKTLTSMVEVLGFPSSFPPKVLNTRALDGTLTAESADGRYLATWSGDSDGLDMVVEVSP